MDSKIKLDDEIETEEQRETFKQTLLRLLDDPQIQQKIGAFLRRSGLVKIHGHKCPSALASLSDVGFSGRAPQTSASFET